MRDQAHADAGLGGSMNQASYDEKVANLVAFLTYVSDPTARTRVEWAYGC
jgi:cytochrome c1